MSEDGIQNLGPDLGIRRLKPSGLLGCSLLLQLLGSPEDDGGTHSMESTEGALFQLLASLH